MVASCYTGRLQSAGITPTRQWPKQAFASNCRKHNKALYHALQQGKITINLHLGLFCARLKILSRSQTIGGMAGMIIIEDDPDTMPPELRAVSCPENCQHDIPLIISPMLAMPIVLINQNLFNDTLRYS